MCGELPHNPAPKIFGAGFVFGHYRGLDDFVKKGDNRYICGLKTLLPISFPVTTQVLK